MNKYEDLQVKLRTSPQRWLITGVAGFIGSNLLESLLKLEQQVVGLDNFATGHKRNLEEVRQLVTREQWARFTFNEGDICNLADCKAALATQGQAVDYVLHQAALGSVSRSIADPLPTNRANVDGFLNMLVAARDAKVKRFVYASSSSVYGDHPALPKVEERIGQPLSPYAATKAMDEIYAKVFGITYNFEAIGLRYFNVFGPRQDPNGAYAAVVPKWIASLLRNDPIHIYGDGETSRDFCYIANVIQANLLAATAPSESTMQAYNIAVGDRTTLNELFQLLQEALRSQGAGVPEQRPVYREFRAGDVRHSLADIEKARKLLHYDPKYHIRQGIDIALEWYRINAARLA